MTTTADTHEWRKMNRRRPAQGGGVKAGGRRPRNVRRGYFQLPYVIIVVVVVVVVAFNFYTDF